MEERWFGIRADRFGGPPDPARQSPAEGPSSPICQLDLRWSPTAPYRTTEAEELDRTFGFEHHGVGLKRPSSVDRREAEYLVFTAESSPDKNLS